MRLRPWQTQGSLRLQDWVNDLSVNIGQPKITPGVTIGHMLMIITHQVQYRRVEVMNGNGVLDRAEAKIIRRTVNGALLDSAARHP